MKYAVVSRIDHMTDQSTKILLNLPPQPVVFDAG